MTRLLIVLVLIAAASQTFPQEPAPQPPPGNASGTNVTPSEPAAANATPSNATAPAPVASDPAAVRFSSDVGLLLVAVKPGNVADYEAMIVALQEALAKADDEETRALAKGWRVYKTDQPDAKSNAIYVHLLQPTRPDADYRPSLLLDKLLAGAPAELLAKYRDAFAMAPTKLSLIEFAHMSVAPVAKPTNATGDVPATPAVPGNATPGNATPGNATPGNATPGKPPR